MRIYDPRVGRFLSVDPIAKAFPELTPYQFASNSPTFAIDLDGLEAKVVINQGYVDKGRTRVQVVATVDIQVQIINLSSTANHNLNLAAIRSGLEDDLKGKLGGSHSASIVSGYTFGKSKNGIAPIDGNSGGKYNFNLTYNVVVNPKVSVITDKSQINSENTFVFALVDNIKAQPDLEDPTGLAYGVGFGKVAIGEAKYFTYSSAPKNGKNLIFHEIVHLLGAIDIYKDPKKSHAINLMNYLSKNNGTLTSNQVVTEIWGETIGNFVNIWLAVQKNGTYQKTPNDADKQDTRKQLEQFVENNTTQE